MDAEYGQINYADMEPEYDMEFARYGPNPMELPMSPPSTPPLDAGDAEFRRELSPFSEASSMTSVTSTDSVGYYREEGGRMFPNLPDAPTVLPVDSAEMRRLSGQYNLVKLVVGDNHFEEIHELLNPPYEASIRVLDVISNSPWIDEMAKEYPHVKFTGCNLVPTRHPHSPNIQLEVYNLHDGFHGRDESYDMIHMFGTFKFSRDFKGWLREMRRLLKPGGILIIIDMEMAVWLRDGSDPYNVIPSIWEYTARMCEGLYAQGIDLRDMNMTGTWLREMGGFSQVEDTVTSCPVGDWEEDELQKEIGTMARENIMSALIATHPLWYRAGKTQEEIDQFITAARAELYESNAELFERLFYTFARKEEMPFEDEI
ncbi:uncharacterized protein FOMMEDRAFT_158822 [Fomitiporia mediterranea MF3/22]|uniref:uncharacterized protein n=1 Tax=Fomitiporia mediterranea (strain MF3/22) TaxID=694068 RepID=UPI0004408362|nr:uncharacterized protein FOMMEDRAFT_158822 [Fomitiporia mediterranea MF3/22]EJD01670.1 hypothetical protein FOMMEDRAFT_158822 [Fomitiporia mediterranea MF3/22]